MIESVTPIVPDGALAGKIIIMGASQGVGKAAAMSFARADATAVLCVRRGNRVEKLAADTESQGGRAIGLGLDVSREDSVKRQIDTAVQLRQDRPLFNNAGVDQKMLPGRGKRYWSWAS